MSMSIKTSMAFGSCLFQFGIWLVLVEKNKRIFGFYIFDSQQSFMHRLRRTHSFLLFVVVIFRVPICNASIFVGTKCTPSNVIALVDSVKWLFRFVSFRAFVCYLYSIPTGNRSIYFILVSMASRPLKWQINEMHHQLYIQCDNRNMFRIAFIFT